MSLILIPCYIEDSVSLGLFPSPGEFHSILKKTVINTIIPKLSIIESDQCINLDLEYIKCQVRVPLIILSKIKSNFGITGNKSITRTWPRDVKSSLPPGACLYTTHPTSQRQLFSLPPYLLTESHNFEARNCLLFGHSSYVLLSILYIHEMCSGTSVKHY